MPKLLTSQNLLGYYPPQLYPTSGNWRIEYSVENPATGEMKRKQIRLNRIKDVAQRRRYARNLIKKLTQKLEQGWNPFLEDSAPKGYVLLKDAFRIFLDNKKRELSDDSIRSYKSHCKMMIEYALRLRSGHSSDMHTISFTQSVAKDYLLWVYSQKEVSSTTYNNYIGTCRSIFSWLVENGYAAQNPFSKISRKKEKQKRRRILDYAERTDLRLFYEMENPRFLAVCLLAYHCLLRPKEITYLKPANFNLKKGYIIPENHTKNSKPRVIAIPIYMVEILKNLGIENLDPKAYVFSSGFRPGLHRLNPRKIATFWERNTRYYLGWGMDLQFYSLRDSGIVQMLRDGIPIEEVQKHADHASITTTQKYITLAFPEGVESVREKSSRF